MIGQFIELVSSRSCFVHGTVWLICDTCIAILLVIYYDIRMREKYHYTRYDAGLTC